MAVFAPNANPIPFPGDELCPIARTWGVNNRSVALRIPTGAPETRHLEHRVAGADGQSLSGHRSRARRHAQGIVEKLDPGPATVAMATPRRTPSCQRLATALRLLRDSTFLQDYFGKRFVEIFHAIKSAECRRFNAQV